MDCVVQGILLHIYRDDLMSQPFPLAGGPKIRPHDPCVLP